MIEILNFANIDTPSFKEERRNYLPYVKYGDNNLFPNELLFLSGKSVTHSACLELYKKAIAGSGYTTENKDPKLAQFLKDLDFLTEGHSLREKIASSLSLYSGYALEIVWNKMGNKIITVKCIPFQNLRASHTNEYDEVEGYYYNVDWERFPSRYSEFIPKFNPLTAKKDEKQILYMYLKSEQSRCYPVPNYSTALNYIATEFEISMHHLSSAVNCFLPSSLITVVGDSEPSDESKREYKKRFNQTHTGTRNSGRTILSFVENAADKILIEPITLDNVVDHYVTTSQECTKMILQANSILTPALLGLTDSNSSIFSDGNELLAAWDLFYKFTIRPYQKLIETGMDIVIEYSGFDNPNYKISPFKLKDDETPEETPIDTAPTEDVNNPVDTTETDLQPKNLLKKIFKKW